MNLIKIFNLCVAWSTLLKICNTSEVGNEKHIENNLNNTSNVNIKIDTNYKINETSNENEGTSEKILSNQDFTEDTILMDEPVSKANTKKVENLTVLLKNEVGESLNEIISTPQINKKQIENTIVPRIAPNSIKTEENKIYNDTRENEDGNASGLPKKVYDGEHANSKNVKNIESNIKDKNDKPVNDNQIKKYQNNNINPFSSLRNNGNRIPNKSHVTINVINIAKDNNGIFQKALQETQQDEETNTKTFRTSCFNSSINNQMNENLTDTKSQEVLDENQYNTKVQICILNLGLSGQNIEKPIQKNINGPSQSCYNEEIWHNLLRSRLLDKDHNQDRPIPSALTETRHRTPNYVQSNNPYFITPGQDSWTKYYYNNEHWSEIYRTQQNAPSKPTDMGFDYSKCSQPGFQCRPYFNTPRFCVQNNVNRYYARKYSVES